MKSSSLILVLSLAVLLNAGFSMLQYRRYVQLELDEDTFSMPRDVSQTAVPQRLRRCIGDDRDHGRFRSRHRRHSSKLLRRSQGHFCRCLVREVDFRTCAQQTVFPKRAENEDIRV